MNKYEFFKRALAAGEYKRKEWIISAFSLIREGAEDWKLAIYPYRIVPQTNGYYFVDPENDLGLTKIEGGKVGEPLFTMRERIDITPADIPNCTKALNTTCGNLLVNWILCVFPFGKKISYLEGKISAKSMEQIILKRLQDDPPLLEDLNNPNLEPKGSPNDPIYVAEYLKFCDASFFLPGLSQLCVPSATERTMTSSPEIPKLKAKLLKENEGHLHDAATIAKIDAQLVDHDKNVWMKGDPGADFYAVSANKSYNIVRRKSFLMMGAEASGLSDSLDVDLIENSLSEGWDISKFPAMNDSLRMGSFNRGANTMLGGESVKWLLRTSANMTVAAEDCGSVLGLPEHIEVGEESKLVGRSVVTPKGPVRVTDENAKDFAGKDVVVRSPMFCKLPKTDYCAHCVGEKLGANPTGVSVAIADYGNTFLYIYMSAAHGKALLLAKMDYRKSIT